METKRIRKNARQYGVRMVYLNYTGVRVKPRIIANNNIEFFLREKNFKIEKKERV